MERPLMTHDDAVDHRQTKARAAAQGFGRKERLKHALADLVRHACAIVLNHNFRALVNAAHGHANAPTIADGVSGVRATVGATGAASATSST